MAMLMGGICVGMRWSSATLGTMDMMNHRSEDFGRIRLALKALDSDNPAELRMGNSSLLYNALMGLAGVPRYGDCKPAERDMIARTRTHLDTDMPASSEGEKAVRSMAYAFCDKPQETVSFP
ncbi:hypothetical protein [Luteibacter yeojuensis]